MSGKRSGSLWHFLFCLFIYFFNKPVLNICLEVIPNIYCLSRLINSKMLSRRLCQVRKCLFLHSVKPTPVKVAALTRRIRSSAERCSDCESKDQAVQKHETGELSQSTESKHFGRLHTPVMLEEVVNSLSPQSGQVS